MTESEWRDVFAVRCRSKRGFRLSDDEFALITRAYKIDPVRYVGLDKEVFEATSPAGSSENWREP